MMTEGNREKLVSHSLAPDRCLLGHEIAGTDQQQAVIKEWPPHLIGEQHHTVIDLGKVKRLVMMVTPEQGASFKDEVWEALSTIRAILNQQDERMAVTMQTVFMRDRADVPIAKKLFAAYFGDEMPLTIFVVQPPCEGCGLAIEAWAVSTDTARVEFHSPELVTVSYGEMRWIYAAGGSLHRSGRTAYDQSADAFESMQRALEQGGPHLKMSSVSGSIRAASRRRSMGWSVIGN